MARAGFHEELLINVAMNLDLIHSDFNNEHLVLQLSQNAQRNILKKLIEPLEYDFIIWDCNPSISVLECQIQVGLRSKHSPIPFDLIFEHHQVLGH